VTILLLKRGGGGSYSAATGVSVESPARRWRRSEAHGEPATPCRTWPQCLPAAAPSQAQPPAQLAAAAAHTDVSHSHMCCWRALKIVIHLGDIIGDLRKDGGLA